MSLIQHLLFPFFQYHAAFNTTEKKETDWPVMVKKLSIDANKLMNRQKGFLGLPLHRRHTKKTL